MSKSAKMARTARDTMHPSLSVGFPLSGEWYVAADGTEAGHELALDFIRLDKHFKATRRSAWRELLTAVPYEQYHGWGQAILSPFDGRVVAAVDGCPEHPQSFLMKLWGLAKASFLSPGQRRRLANLLANGGGDIREFAGNHLIIESVEFAGIYAFLAHARRGSLKVKAGDMVRCMQPIAEVGDSGQSIGPHLHFQLMSSPNPLTQQLVPFSFSVYEAQVDGHWLIQRQALPPRGQRIRSLGPDGTTSSPPSGVPSDPL
ncbi:M23 family metallopeptidase [Paucibacter sp. APW11]|uniref:M23 family metallopeptidase n=1 Tax=Roseateles aquae TaxID=3077235 RepID=A0ABU3PIK4_9BURK|nr:M23 family metallopeptidase [Paucibacter sp. APW11]MDT9002385.1 M23 family metallopeptidase [Paucibacter sp. APW11]